MPLRFHQTPSRRCATELDLKHNIAGPPEEPLKYSFICGPWTWMWWLNSATYNISIEEPSRCVSPACTKLGEHIYDAWTSIKVSWCHELNPTLSRLFFMHCPEYNTDSSIKFVDFPKKSRLQTRLYISSLRCIFPN